MGLFQSFDISASGMTAERFRIDTISGEYCQCQYNAYRRTVNRTAARL